MRKLLVGASVIAGLMAGTAYAQETVKLGYIDPLSGGGASVGEGGLKTYQWIADEINAQGGLLGKKLEILPLDSKTNPQEAVVQAQKAIDAGARFITQGNGSSVAAALSDFVTKYNERNPGKEVLFFNYAAVDDSLTNEKCSFWHFRWDANSGIKMAAITSYLKNQPNVKKVYLINQDYSFGQGFRKLANQMLKEKRPDVEIVGDELHPLLKVTDFSPYIAKIKASGADSVLTGNWGQDIALLLKAAADAGLQVNWYTYYAGGAGGPTAIKQILHDVKTDDVLGRLIFIPVLNVQAFRTGTRDSVGADDVNLNRAFVDGAGSRPGLNGITHRLAAFIRTSIWPHVHIVLDDDVADVRRQRGEDLDQLAPLGRRQPRRRLVEQYEARRTRERERDLELALLAVRQLGDEGLALVRQMHGIHELLGRMHQRFVATRPHERVATARDTTAGEIDVVDDGEPGEQQRDLVGASETPADALVRGKHSHVLA